MPVPSADTVAAVLRHADAVARPVARHPVRSAAHSLDQRATGAPAGLPARGGMVCASQLAGLGFRADVRPTAGPSGRGRASRGPDGYRGPHVLFYGHYDVQPVDPLELWHSPPFEPQLVDGPHGKRFVARGAVDDKGQTMMFLEALRAWHAAGGGIPARITVLIEGEEEVGSRQPRTVPGGQQGRARAPTSR